MIIIKIIIISFIRIIQQSQHKSDTISTSMVEYFSRISHVEKGGIENNKTSVSFFCSGLLE